MIELRRLCHILLGICVLAGLTATAQTRPSDAQERFRYSFSNLVWWSDADLRATLKRQIPGLGDEMGRDSPMETRVRTTLMQLLKQKGINAEVQIFEPAADWAKGRRVPEAPPVSISFSVRTPPEIVVGPVSIEGAPPEAAAALDRTIHAMQTKTYSANTFWLQEGELKRNMWSLGYLSANASLSHGPPARDGDRYLVPLTASIVAGPKYHVSSVKVDGGPLLQGRDLSGYVTVKPGDVAIHNAFGQLGGTLRAEYWRAGYADVEFQGDPVLDESKGLASYRFEVVPGPMYRVRSVKVENLNPEQEAAVSAMLFKPGDVYNLMTISSLSHEFKNPGSVLKGYDFSYSTVKDKEKSLVDLVLTFYK